MLEQGGAHISLRTLLRQMFRPHIHSLKNIAKILSFDIFNFKIQIIFHKTTAAIRDISIENLDLED